MNIINNIAGQQFGSLTAIYPEKEKSNGHVVWQCICKCGNTVKVRKDYLTVGRVTQCPNCTFNDNVKKIQGKTFGSLTAIKLTKDHSFRHSIWECHCSCGNVVYVRSDHLLTGDTQQCPACAKKSRQRYLTEHNKKRVLTIA